MTAADFFLAFPTGRRDTNPNAPPTREHIRSPLSPAGRLGRREGRGHEGEHPWDAVPDSPCCCCCSRSPPAEETPEQLLPAATQVYLRWDGVEAHRAAYDKSALGRMMQGDTGAFVNELYGQLQDGLSALLTVDQLLGGVAPEKLAKMQADANEAAKLLPALSKNGFILAGEVRDVEGPNWQATLILPDSDPKAEPLPAALRLIAALAKLPVKDVKSGDVTAHSIGEDFVHVTWWQEGKNSVLTLSSDKPEDLLKRMHARTGPASTPTRCSSESRASTSSRPAPAPSWTWRPSRRSLPRAARSSRSSSRTSAWTTSRAWSTTPASTARRSAAWWSGTCPARARAC